MSSISFYKPNSRSTGSAASFTCRRNPKHDNNYQSYLNILKQTSWDAASRKASFKSSDPENEVAIKLNEVELGGICRAMLKKEKFSTVHKFDKTMTSIAMEWTSYKDNELFSISVSKNGKKYSIGLSPNEVYCAMKILEDSILKLCQ